jgi:hypothetical protein
MCDEMKSLILAEKLTIKDENAKLKEEYPKVYKTLIDMEFNEYIINSAYKFLIENETIPEYDLIKDIVDDVSKIKCENENITHDDKEKGKEDGAKNKNEIDFNCKICLDKMVNITFIPCGHLCCCNLCSPNLRKCPICRTRIKSSIKTFI